MKTIFKYPLAVTRRQTIELPRHAVPLTIQMQNGVPCLWALVDNMPSALDQVEFACYGTGHEMENFPGVYVGTVQLSDGTVWHYFRV